MWEKIRHNIFFKGFVALVALVLLVVLMDRVVMPLYVRFGDEVELPDVVEMKVDQAKEKLAQNDFIAVLADSVYDADYPTGTVVEQMPLPYSVVKKGRHVYLTVSIGEKPIHMPNLFYKSPRDAELILKAYGLERGAKYYRYSDMSLAGVVISQSYPPGQIVKKGAKVDITISLGPLPKQRKIPDLLGKSLDKAKNQLKQLGISKIKVEYVEQDNILPETIVGQSVKAGTPITDSTVITLRVSKIKHIGER